MTSTNPADAALADAIQWLRGLGSVAPEVALILGSGLGDLANRIEDATRVAFADIPGMVSATAGGHAGQLILGRLAAKPVVAMAGRLHRYEGWSDDQVAFPVRLMSGLGCRRLIVSNAAGGVNPKLRVGDIVVIRDHINLMPPRWSGPNDRRGLPIHDAFAPLRHASVYDPAMCRAAMGVGIARSFAVWEGTYLATLGPTYETRSEYRMMRRIGADVVGMSTVPEVLAAVDEKMRVLGLSLVSNAASPDLGTPADHDEVLRAGAAAGVKMEAIVRGVIQSA